MSLLRESQARTATTPLVFAQAKAGTTQLPVEAIDPAVIALQDEVERLETALAEQARRTEQAIAAARDEGRAEAAAGEDNRIRAIDLGIECALAAWRERLAETEILAAMLARTALAKVFGDDADRIGQVERAISHALARLEPQAVIGIAVSAGDFSGDGLAALADRLGSSIALYAEQSPAGSCRIDLRLGRIVLDPIRQWDVLEAALRDMERSS